MSFPGGSDSKESANSEGDPDIIPGWGRSPGEEKDNPLPYSCLKNSMDRGAWQVMVYGLQRVGHDWATNTFTFKIVCPKKHSNLLFLFWHDKYALVININVLVNPKGNQSWIFIGRTDVKAEAPILWPPDEKSLLIGKDPDAGKNWRQEAKGTTEDETVGWHHRLNGHEFELDMTEPLNNATTIVICATLKMLLEL